MPKTKSTSTTKSKSKIKSGKTKAQKMHGKRNKSLRKTNVKGANNKN